jgi:hypothetical protein
MKLDMNEYIVESHVKNHSFQARIFFRLIVPLVIVFTGYFTVVYVLPNIYKIKTNDTLNKIPVYKLLYKVYFVFMIIVLLAMIYFFISSFVSKIMLTNKALIKRNVFSIDKIYFNDITRAELSTTIFRFNRNNGILEFFLRLLLNINYTITIKSGNRELRLTDFTKKYANAILEKIKTNTVASISRV